MNDSRVTSYALGELTGREREEFERELAESEDLQRELNETINIADVLGKLPMPTETLTEKEREECRQNLKISRQKITRRRVIGAVALGTLAACLLIAPVSPWMARIERKAAFSTAEAPKVQAPNTPLVAASISQLGDSSSVNVASPTLPAQPPELQFNVAAASTQPTIATGNVSPEPLNFTMTVQASQEAPLSAPPAASAPATSSGLAPGFTSGSGALVAGAWASKARAQSSAVQAGERGSIATVADDIPIAGRLFRTEEDEKPRAANREFNAEAYDVIRENVFLTARENPLSTFSIDVDTASYANVRRFLQRDQLPPAGAIRTEELINYFSYDYQQPEGDAPFSVNLEVSRAPWDAERQLVRIGLKGKEIPASERGPANLVFLLDVSGSMDKPDKLPLLQRSLQELVNKLSPKDRVAIVVYAGSSGLVLPSTPGTDKERILKAIEDLKAGGSTNGGKGIKLAYKIAKENFLKGGNNRVILGTDGDFNVGTTSDAELVRLIEKERSSGVFLSVLGFGTGNLKDSKMEKLADKGNGNYAYIDSITEGRKVLVEQMGATLFTIAKDVKIQVEFNPAKVAGYRLIGYENRLLAKEDFNDDKKDAGEIGAGHSVTALYEVIPVGQPMPDRPSVDPLKYQITPPASTIPASTEPPASLKASPELLTVKLRYKAPDGDKSKLLEFPLTAPEVPAFERASDDFQFAAAVAAFGMKLRGSPTAGDIGWNDIKKIVRRTLGEDPGSYRAEFLTLIEKAARLAPARETSEEE